MADPHHPPADQPPRYDSELAFKSILYFAGGVAGATVLALLAMWWMSASFKAQEEAKDRAPSPIAAARLDPIPPGPRLQASPPRDMDEMRARDREALTTYGWADKTGGVARIPVDRAIQILAQKGLGQAPKKEPK
ncbi:MAG TPA: hypothetical protein VJT73_21605 [Polyangiaceae bacterium]|nr:hypothetical protein [Polyangiaceae bacterium]